MSCTYALARKRVAEGISKVLVLNLASPVHPGVGVRKGARAQEEDLCRKSSLLVNSSTGLTNWKNADLSQDNIINSIDLSLLKRRLISGATLSPYSGLVINEVCTSNKTSLKDSSGNSPDWIEIFNSSSDDMDISGVGVSESSKKRYKFAFPANTVLQSGGYIVIACDKELQTDGLKYIAPMNLSASCETVYLSTPARSDGSSGADIDIVTVPALAADVTFGRLPNSSDKRLPFQLFERSVL